MSIALTKIELDLTEMIVLRNQFQNLVILLQHLKEWIILCFAKMLALIFMLWVDLLKIHSYTLRDMMFREENGK